MSKPEQAMKRRRWVIALSIIGAVVAISIIIGVSASVATQQQQSQTRLVKSNISANEIHAIVTENGHDNTFYVMQGSIGIGFTQLWIEDKAFATKLGINNVVCANGTHRVIQMDNAQLSGSNDPGTTFAFFYLGNWYLRNLAIDVAKSELVNGTLAWILANTS